MEGLFFLLELVMISVAGLVACVGLVACGGLARNRAGLFAFGLYLLVFGAGLSLLPQLLWPVARTDNAFLGQFALSFLLLLVGLILTIASGVSLARRGHAWPIAGRAGLRAAVGVLLGLGLLVVRGPEPWQTRDTDAFGSGTFGFDVVVASVVIGALVFATGRNLGRGGEGEALGVPTRA
jgi:hypothetical protein